MNNNIINDSIMDALINNLKNNAQYLLMAFIRGLGTIGLNVSFTLIIVGLFCLIFNYKKPLKYGLFGFLFSIIISILGGNL